MTDDYIITNSGIRFRLFDPHPDQIDIHDIAHALSHTVRYGGHLPFPYSVGQHCLAVEFELAERSLDLQTRLLGLLHDAPEAYIGDMVNPLKAGDDFYKIVEAQIWAAVRKKFNLPPDDSERSKIVKEYDARMLLSERRDLASEPVRKAAEEVPWWHDRQGFQPLERNVWHYPYTTQQPFFVKEEFLDRFYNLTRRIENEK